MYGDLPPRVADELSALQFPGGNRHGTPANPEHPGKKQVGEVETIAMGAIVRHQQPPSQTRLDFMERVACGSLCQLFNQYVKIAIERALQIRALPELQAKLRSRYPQRTAGSLYDCPQRGGADTECECCTQHPFVSDHAHFDGLVTANGGYQGDVTRKRKVDMPDRLSGIAQYLAKNQLLRRALRQKLCPRPAWHGLDQTIDHG